MCGETSYWSSDGGNKAEEGSRPLIRSLINSRCWDEGNTAFIIGPQRPNPIPNFIWSHGGRPADFSYLILDAVWAVPQTAITTCVNAGVQSAPNGAVSRPFTSQPLRNVVVTSHRPPSFSSLSVRRLLTAETFEVSQQTQNGVAHSLAQSRVDASRLCLTVEAQRGFVETEFLSSGSPQGLSSPMLVVIFLSSLFTSLFSFFLNYLKCYLSNNEIWKDKKKNLSFLCILFMEKLFCVFSLFLCRKKSSLSVEMIQMIWTFFCWVSFFCLFLCILRKRFSVVYCLERSQSQCISVDPVSVMYVCLTTLRKICHWMGFKKYKKCRLSYFYNWLYLCILYQWNFFILEIKGYNNKKILEKKLSGLVVWPDPDWSPSMISSWRQRKLAFDIRFSRRSLALFLSLLFPHLGVSFFLSFLLCFCSSLKEKKAERRWVSDFHFYFLLFK